MSAPRGLSTDEEAAWERLAQSVTPMAGRTRPSVTKPAVKEPAHEKAKPVGTARPAPVKPKSSKTPPVAPPPRIADGQTGLDGHWERRFKSGRIEPDLTLDLHGHTLDSAHARITAGLDQARAMGARVVLVIAGRERPVDPADRAHRRGAIRAKLLDWALTARNHQHHSRAHRPRLIEPGCDPSMRAIE
ncbi:MAG: Smr/MutS family protein, partial [Pseudomonadota bacterium]